jgi:hypothetical protein
METPTERAVPAGSLSVPFSLLFAQKTVPTREGDQTGGAETETQTSLDGIVKTDSEEDEDVDS